MSEPIIEVRHLSKSFGTHVVLRDVDFTVNPGDVTCVIGASGSGKSTLLRCVNLLETPTNGAVLFHGQEITEKGFDPCSYRAKVGMVFQSFNLFNNMTVLENCTAGLRYVLHQDKETARRTALENLEKVGMAPYIHAKPRQLSGGQKQRVAIARALSMKPEVLLFDEPTSALDPQMVGEVLSVPKEQSLFFLSQQFPKGLHPVIAQHDFSTCCRLGFSTAVAGSHTWLTAYILQGCFHIGQISGHQVGQCPGAVAFPGFGHGCQKIFILPRKGFPHGCTGIGLFRRGIQAVLQFGDQFRRLGRIHFCHRVLPVANGCPLCLG